MKREEIENEIETELGFKWTPQMRHGHKALKLWDKLIDARLSLSEMKADIVAAAGCLMVPVPLPGTDAARVMIANRLLKYEVEELKRDIENLRTIGASIGLNEKAEAEPEGEFIVELEAGVWVDDVRNGDPGRTLKKRNAEVFSTRKAATVALGLAREMRPFKNARVVDTDGERCGECEGKGVIGLARDSLLDCEKCEGLGRFEKKVVPFNVDVHATEEEIKRGEMKATVTFGEEAEKEKEPCRKCGGDGQVFVSQESREPGEPFVIPCPECTGTWEAYHDKKKSACRKCGGSGVMREDRFDVDGRPCEGCNGTGKVLS